MREGGGEGGEEEEKAAMNKMEMTISICYTTAVLSSGQSRVPAMGAGGETIQWRLKPAVLKGSLAVGESGAPMERQSKE